MAKGFKDFLKNEADEVRLYKDEFHQLKAAGNFIVSGKTIIAEPRFSPEYDKLTIKKPEHDAIAVSFRYMNAVWTVWYRSHPLYGSGFKRKLYKFYYVTVETPSRKIRFTYND